MEQNITVAIRFADGRIATQHRPEQTLSEWLMDIRIYQGDPAYLADFLASQDHRETVPLAPNDWGLIVIDYVSNRILSIQDTISIDGRSLVCDAEKLRGNFTVLLAANRLREVTYRPLEEPVEAPLSPTIVTFDDLVDRAQQAPPDTQS